MKILGICHDVLICSAALLIDGEVVFATPEERLDRVKQSRGFPRRAIDACLRAANLSMNDLDAIAVGWNPGVDSETPLGGFTNARRWRTEHWSQVPTQFLQMAGAQASLTSTISDLYPGAPPITFVNHYYAHIGNAFLQSPHEEAAVLILDGRGEKHTVLHAMGKGAKVETLSETFFPHSLGLFYGAITQFLGHRPDSDEWKVMALASYVDGDNEFYPVLRDCVSVDADGKLRLDLSFFEFYNFWDRRMYSDRLVAALGAPRSKDAPYTDRDHRIAAAMQRVFEEVSTELLGYLHKKTGAKVLTAAGGCFMNSVYNGKITRETPFSQAYLGFCPDDSGTSLGAAAWLHAQLTGERPKPLTTSYLGRQHDASRIEQAVTGYKLPNAQKQDDVCDAAAKDLAEGKLIGWFQGRSEFGQRALGNRSILADPRSSTAKDKVNAAVKFREAFRPFAPAILAERVADYFEATADERVPYMEKVLPFRKDKASQVPAVVHQDGTGRLQSVTADGNPRFHGLIAAFEKRAEVPIVLNTSFNLNGEPIVDAPEDAIRTFYSCGLDVLYLGDYRIAKG